MKKPSITLLSLVANFLCATCAQSSFKSISIPPTISNTTSVAQFISDSSFDGPKVTNINSSSYDWWYFDAVSLDSNYSIVAVFYASPNTSFIGAESATDILEVQIRVQTPEEDVFFAVDSPSATAGKLTLDGNDITGDWEGTGSRFLGRDLTCYNVTFDSDAAEELGISGFISMTSVRSWILSFSRL